MKISIAMCTYNGADFLPEQLQSFVAQTRLPDELIVCDDCSKDSTVNIIHQFSKTAPFIVRLFVNETNLGLVKNFEKAISLCEGDIIFLSDQDDVWHSEKLKIFHDVFAAKSDVGLVFCDAEVVDEDLNKLGVTTWQTLDFNERKQQLMRTDASFDFLLKKIAVFGCMAAFRAEFKQLVLPIADGDFRVIHDNWIAILISAVAKIEPVPQCLVSYRQHSAQQIGHRVSQSELNFVQNALYKYEYDKEIKLLTLLLENLKSCAARFPAEKAIKTLESRLYHFKRRSEIRDGGLKKFHLIAEEVITGRYQAHSGGYKSAVKDLFT